MVRMALEFVELDTVQLLKALATVLADEVVLDFGGMLLHMPVE